MPEYDQQPTYGTPVPYQQPTGQNAPAPLSTQDLLSSWHRTDISRDTAERLFGDIIGHNPTSPAPFVELHAPGSMTVREVERWGTMSHDGSVTEGITETFTHEGARGLRKVASVSRQRMVNPDGSAAFRDWTRIESREADPLPEPRRRRLGR